jgi:hypothetical protein
VRIAAVTFTWQVEAAAESRLQVARDAGFDDKVLDTALVGDSLTADLGVDGRYFWRVRPRSEAGAWGEWAGPRMLTVERFRLVASVKTQGYPHDVWVRGGRAYVADGQAGLAVFDVTNPEAPAFLGSKMDSLNEAWGVVADDSFAYIAYGYKELVIVDVRQTDSLAITGVLEYLQPGSGYDIALQDSFVYVAADAQFVKIKVARPSAPELVFQGYNPRDCRGVALSGRNAYVALGQLGFAVWRIDTTPIVQIGSADTPGNARGIAVSGNNVYVADGREGLLVADASSPAAPAVAGRLPLAGYALNVTVAGNCAYVACGDGGLSVVDVTVPGAPRLLARLDTPHMVGVSALGPYIFGGDRDLGLVVIKREE